MKSISICLILSILTTLLLMPSNTNITSDKKVEGATLTVNRAYRVGLEAVEGVNSNFRSPGFNIVFESNKFDAHAKTWRVKISGVSVLIDDSSGKALAISE